jgi:hypothetical protein
VAVVVGVAVAVAGWAVAVAVTPTSGGKAISHTSGFVAMINTLKKMEIIKNALLDIPNTSGKVSAYLTERLRV